MRIWLTLVVAAAIAVTTGRVSGAADIQESLTAARDLYAAAEYEDALMLLNRLRSTPHAPEEGRTIDQYRAFCLLALGRASDAEQAIAAVVLAEPSFQPSVIDVSPRIRTAFSDVRRRMLPVIIQQQYTAAKMAFDQKNYLVAKIGFRQVLDAMSDPDVATAAGQPPLSDVRTLASGFYDLSANVAVAPPPPPQPPAPAAAAAASVEAQSVAQPGRIYGPEDVNVVPPIVIRQVLPPFPNNVPVAGRGVLEVLIDENGDVVGAMMRASVSPQYDNIALNAAKSWKYRPAAISGVPVKYRKNVQINIKR
jgi:hypothetical protein